jgi:hypothetical protein
MKRTCFAVVASLLAALAAAAADKGSEGRFAPGQAFTPPADHAPPRTSRAFVKTVAARDGRAEIQVPTLGSPRLLIWTIVKGAPVATAVRAPGGRALAAGEARSVDGSLRRVPLDVADLGLDLPGALEALEVRDAEPGAYVLEVETEGSAAVSVVAAEPESTLALTTWAGPLSHRTDDPVVLGATLRDGRQAVSARVTARLAGPKGTAGESVELFDDGRHDDGAAGDGAYGARVEGAANAAGFWSVRFDAVGQDANGASFERTSSSGFMTESGAASLDATRATLGRGLRVAAVADVRVSGRYRLDVLVATPPDADGRQVGVAWAQAPRTLAVGRTPLALTVSSESLGDAASGPLFVDVRLIGLDAPGVSRTTLAVPAR